MESTRTTLDRHGGGWLTAARFAGLSVVLFGAVIPLALTKLNLTLFPAQAQASLIVRDGQMVGSTLVGQPFAAAGYFSGRPSAAGYDPRAAAGSNLAGSNPALAQRMRATALAIAEREGVALERIPVDLISASGSGLDPHISVDAARLQVARVARARQWTEDQVNEVLAAHIEGPTLGVFGQPRVNVLLLNLALDQAAAP